MGIVTGHKELNKALDSITNNKFRKAALVDAGKNVMKPVLFHAKANAPTLKISEKNPDHAVADELKNDIKLKYSFNESAFSKGGNLKKNSNELTVSVTTGNATKDYAINAEYGRPELIAVRTEAFGRQTKLFEALVPEMIPNPYMLPALKAIEGTADRKFGKHLYKSIQVQLKRHAKLRK